MSISLILTCLLVLAALGFELGRRRALSREGRLHSLPGYYGWSVALWTLGPALGLLVLWSIVQPMVVNDRVIALLPPEAVAEAGPRELALSDVRRFSSGLGTARDMGVVEDVSALEVGSDALREAFAAAGTVAGFGPDAATLEAAKAHLALTTTGNLWRGLAVLALALAGLGYGLSRITADFRARNAVEAATRGILLSAASIAVLTTAGIVLSLIFNTVKFFGLYPASEFFFGTTWSPSFGGGSSLGILPLLWGTLYISVVALAVAVPLGLFAAIYLSEYASPKVRAWGKPALEILAGIPTIVYGLFALLTVGPLLMEIFGPDGIGWMRGGTSVMTAGLVMGIMLIPFVSSLSDDIINAVPQSMRDGSLGLGATQSETIRQVILPAALPGIVGAILLAASRAIGETMIVVLGAGAAARLDLNPFEAMTTVTAKIVSQLTGDADFSSPEALVAFALGMTLFVITLGLNVFALWIVRRYREQYE